MAYIHVWIEANKLSLSAQATKKRRKSAGFAICIGIKRMGGLILMAKGEVLD
ncbi:hypothetical protein PARA125_000505 [Parachlamydia sp. AcF125]|nr:hypothetical protein [Parachlamydia sp. AcF125]